MFFSACTLKKVQNHHGIHFLKEKHEKLVLHKSNKNDILSLLGPPSTESSFDNNLWIYIERRVDRSSIFNADKKKIILNNVLILEINNMGLLKKKELLDLTNMKDLDFVQATTLNKYKKNTFVYDFLSSMRQKINDPLGKRK